MDLHYRSSMRDWYRRVRRNQIETDRRIVRRQNYHLKKKLEKIEAQRITKVAHRKGFIKASLVGYTNAGKSTLLNILTKSDVLVEDKLFATLDSTTRSLPLENKQTLLLSDTVGFNGNFRII